MNKLDYSYGNTPKPNSFRIQASSVGSFVDYKTSWYREKLLGEEGFTGNTMSVTGTCLHYLAEQTINNGLITAEDKEECYSYIDLQASDLVDPEEVRTNLTPMWRALKSYLDFNPVTLAEPFIELELAPNLTVGGSIDAIRTIDGSTVEFNGDATSTIEQLRGMSVELIDWKSTSAKTAPTAMARGYHWQLLTYAYVLKKKYDITVTQVTNVYITKEQGGEISPKTGKPFKLYPSETSEVTKPVTDDDLAFIESLIFLIRDSVEAFVTKPELRYLLASDYRLKDHTAPLPFNFTNKSIEV